MKKFSLFKQRTSLVGITFLFIMNENKQEVCALMNREIKNYMEMNFFNGIQND